MTEERMYLMKPFYKIALFFYKLISSRFPRLFVSAQVETDLAKLYPGEARESRRTEYYVKKLAYSLAIASAGAILGVAVHFTVRGKIILGEGGRVPRNSYEQGTVEITVAVDYQDREIDVRLPVEFQKPDEETMDALCQELSERLPELIRGRNESLDAVSGSLNLQESYEGYPFAIEWESSNVTTVTPEGDVYPEEEPQTVLLRAELSYEEYCRETEIEVTVGKPPLGEEELLYRELEQLVLAAEADSRGQESFRLPEQFRGEGLEWRQVVEDNGPMLWMASLAAAVAVYVLSDRDLHDRLVKRQKTLRREYPELVHKLVLFVGAGMTVRGALQKMAGDYTAGREQGAGESPAYEELRYTCRELYSGVSEGAAYEHFGRRTGLQEYIRFCTLLTQNLKRGNSMLLERLREEADRAADERLQQSRKLGEEAGTKLLIPMVMMLAVVMVMIMVPAFAGM